MPGDGQMAAALHGAQWVEWSERVSGVMPQRLGDARGAGEAVQADRVDGLGATAFDIADLLTVARVTVGRNAA
jgi:hypothetical protein